MGTYQKSLLGNVSGKIGGVVYSSYRGVPVVRSAPRKRSVPPSPLQLKQTTKFSMMIKFLRPLTEFLNETHKYSKFKMSGCNKMMSENMRNAFSGDYPNLTIDYGKIFISRGNLSGPGNPSAVSTGAGKIEFTWIANIGEHDFIYGADTVFVAVYNETMGRWIINIKAGIRSAGSCVLDASLFTGKSVHVYIGFIAANERRVTDSIYLGTVSVE